MATLLTLPRELRDAIYEYLTEGNWPPATPLLVMPDKHKMLTYFPAEHAKWQPIRLLSVNRQLRAEVQDYISQQRKQKGRPKAELDINVKGYVYTPTWTHLDYTLHPKDQLELLNVNLHIHSTESFHRPRHIQRPGFIFDEFLSLLCRVIFIGPSCLDPSPGPITPGPHFIKLLSVKILFHDYYTPDTWPATAHEIFRNLKMLSMLNTAYRYLGAVHASVEYERRGQITARKAEWEVRPGGQSRYPGGSRFTETNWTTMGFYFGEEWLRSYKPWQALPE